MNTKFDIRSFLALLACGAIALFGACGQASAGESNGTSNWIAGSDSDYHTIIDFTQGSSDNVVVSNTQSTSKQRSYPYIGSDTDPWAAINPANYPPGYTAAAPDLYVNVKFDNSDILNGSLSTATINTCDQGDPTKCPSGTLPNTFVHRLGNYNGSTVTALTNAKLTGGYESLNNMFTKNGQAFDMDRLRYAANRLWYEWYLEKTGAKTGPWTGFTYQPTGTMSFENFVNNIVNHHTMYGIVRVVIPVETQGGSGKRQGDMYLDPSYPVAGAEFATNPAPVWSGTGTNSSQPVMVDYEAMWPGTSIPKSANNSNKREPYSGTVTVYGMLLIDYVDSRTYDPAHFFDGEQDYVDNYSTQALHDAVATDTAALANIKNYILPRSSGRNVVLMDWDTLDINPIDDLVSQVQYTDTPTAGGDGRMDTLDRIRREYMMAGKTNYAVTDISDDYMWEYEMRQAILLPAGNSTRNQIITALTGNPPGDTGTGTAQFDYATQTFTNTTGVRQDFVNGWSSMTEPNQFHAYFPSGYEMGWMKAFFYLDMAALDQTTTEQTPGSWWMHLPDDVSSTETDMAGSPAQTKGYAEFGVPNTADGWFSVSLDGTAADARAMPNFFSTDWEDFPAFAFAGGLLDVHGFMNCSGMLYTPDSLEIEAHSGSELPGGSSNAGPFQYVNGAMLVGNGFFLQDQNTGDHSMIAISYNFNSFDRLRSGAASVTIKGATNIAELQGQ